MKQLLLFLLLLTCSCVSLDKAIDRATKTKAAAEQTQNAIQVRWPVVVATKFNEWFPFKDSTTVRRDTIEVERVIPGDSVECPGSTQVNPITGETKAIAGPKVKCPDKTILERTISEHSATIRQNTVALAACQEQAKEAIKALQVQNDTTAAFASRETARANKAEATASKRGWWLAGLTLLFFASVAMWIRPKI